MRLLKMNRSVWTRSLGFLVALAISSLLLISAFAHLSNPYQFFSSILKYDLLPSPAAKLSAACLPFVHLAVAGLLLTGVAQRTAFQLGAALFATYGVVQLSALVRGLKVDCGCFGPSTSLIGPQSILLAMGAAILCIVGSTVSQERDDKKKKVSISSSNVAIDA